MGIRLAAILDRFRDLLTPDQIDANALVTRLQTPSLAAENDLIFISEAKHLADARLGKSQIWVIKSDLMKDIGSLRPKSLIRSSNPYLAMALVGHEFFPDKPGIIPVDGAAIHPSAVVAKSARLGHRAKIGPGAVISDGCDIGEDVVIGSNCVLEPNVKIGRGSHIHALVFIGHGCEVGADCEIKPNSTIGGEGFGFAPDEKGRFHRITHYGRVIIEDRVSIGSGVQIDRGTFEDSRIGEGTKIDNHSHFGHNIRIGKNSIIVAGALAAGSVSIGSHCIVGGRVSMAGHLEITDRVQLMAHSGVGKSIEKPGQYGGVPLQSASEEMRTRATLPLIPKFRKQIARILKKLEMDDEA